MTDKFTVIFGGTGGIGTALSSYYTPLTVASIGTNDCDITNLTYTREYIQKIKPDNLIILSAININGMLHKQTDQQILDQIAVNITGVTNLISEALIRMRKNKYGRIILMSSIVAEVTVPGTSVYAAGKGYYETLVKVIAKENAFYNVTANCIKLGYINAGMTFTQVPEPLRAKIKENIPCQEFGSVEQIHNVCKTIIDNNYINGATIRMAGGL